ncbi:MAG: ribbon-helix-helix domain-containing protein [Candidatus Nanohaloarchaea archaeon]|nr:ribbon-helix-helix domain-containing protein [Candidatus Nanohaloarchaea archaeon]
MATVSVKIPDRMKEAIKAQSEEELYQNGSEYIRDAIREKLERGNGLTAAEERALLERLRQVDEGEVETVPLDDA